MTSSVLDRDLAAPGVFPVVEHADVTLLRDLLERLSAIEGDPGRVGVRSDAERIDQLRLLEEIKSAAAGAQARITVEFEASQLRQQADAGVLARQRGKGIGDQVALARGPSAAQGARHLGFATAVVREMPHTHALLRAGRISEWAATLLVRETAVLTREDRATMDERLCATGRGGREGPGRRARCRGGRPPRRQGGPGPAGHRPAGARHDELRHRPAAGPPGRGGVRESAGCCASGPRRW
jgi:hypothetical protein